MKKKMMLIVTHSDDDPERANLALAFAAAMVAEEIDLVMVFMFKGVLLAKKGVIEDLAVPHVTAGKELLPIIREGNVRFWACTPCAQTHEVDQQDLIDGCSLISAVSVVPEMAAREVITF